MSGPRDLAGLEARAKAGDAQAQYLLSAVLSRQGRKPESRQWLERAAAAGLADALYTQQKTSTAKIGKHRVREALIELDAIETRTKPPAVTSPGARLHESKKCAGDSGCRTLMWPKPSTTPWSYKMRLAIASFSASFSTSNSTLAGAGTVAGAGLGDAMVI